VHPSFCPREQRDSISFGSWSSILTYPGRIMIDARSPNDSAFCVFCLCMFCNIRSKTDRTEHNVSSKKWWIHLWRANILHVVTEESYRSNVEGKWEHQWEWDHVGCGLFYLRESWGWGDVKARNRCEHGWRGLFKVIISLSHSHFVWIIMSINSLNLNIHTFQLPIMNTLNTLRF
jgi:hypothetical protein